MDIEYSSHFQRAYAKLKVSLQKRAEIAERLFRLDPFHPKLGTHKLKGKNKVVFLDVGDHDIYK